MADYNSSLPVRTETDGDVAVKVVDSTGAYTWAIDSSGVGSVSFAAGNSIEITDGTDNVEVNADGSLNTVITDGTDTLAINTGGSINTVMTDGTDTIAIDASGNLSTLVSDGTDTLAVNTDGSINVNVVQTTVGTEKHIYGTTSAGVPSTPSSVVNYTVTALKTFILKEFGAACSGKAKIELKAGTSGSEATLVTAFVSTAQPNYDLILAQPVEVVAGDKILVVVTNRDNANADLYAFINGNEV